MFEVLLVVGNKKKSTTKILKTLHSKVVDKRMIQNMIFIVFTTKPVLASVAQLDAPSDWRPGGHRFNPRRGLRHSFVEIDHEIFFTAILSFR